MIGERAKDIIGESLVCDLTLPWMEDCEPKDKTLDRFRDAGFDFVSLTVGADRTEPLKTIQYIISETRRLSRSEHICIAGGVADIRRARTEGKTSVGFHFQGTNPLAGDINMVEVFYQLGVRHLLLSYNLRNMFADGCHERTDAGLSRKGLSLIERMNEVGMLIDCAHTGYRSSMDIIAASCDPVIFSHVNVFERKNHARNIKDEQIRACAAGGGLIGLTGVGMFLRDDNHATVEALADHIEYVIDLVGAQHVSLGLDFIYYEEVMYARYQGNRETYPDGYPLPPWQCLAPESLGKLVEALVARGLPRRDIVGLLGENFLRVAELVWK
jgi:membrane dipeptidase